MTNDTIVVDWHNLPFHPIANLFPLINGPEFDALVSDIAANGLIEPIWLNSSDNSIIDGRNRYRACLAAGVTPTFRRWDGNGGLVQFVLSLNLHRRHLTSSQLAAIAVEVLPWLEEEAKKRQRLSEGRGQKGVQKIAHLNDEDEFAGRASYQAAKLLGTNRQYVLDMKRLNAEAPALFAAVRDGQMTVTQAKREYIRTTAPEPIALPSSRYRVIYADPPWKYNNTQPDYYSEQANHYRLMDLDEICALPVSELAEENAVLFMWATSPILEESFAVVRAWGFRYKSSFVWDKMQHNMGHYNSVRHEFLLICTRGSCQPDVPKLFDSVQSIKRTEHSRKPEEFRTIIDTIYPYGRRIELFARNTAPGWDVWGNEVHHAI
jgi:N6-adenosine-specific RNA methylase IME4